MFKNSDLKFTSISNKELKDTFANELDLLSKNFFLFKYKEDSSNHWILAYTNNLCAENIVGIMELIRYPIIENATIVGKIPIPFNFFDIEDFYYYNDDYPNLSRLDTFIEIHNVEILKGFRNQGIGSKLYEFLEDTLTYEDSLVELTRTIEGRTHNLLSKIEKVPTFTDINDLYDSL